MSTSIAEPTGPAGLGIDPDGYYRVLDEAQTVLAVAQHGRPLAFRDGGRSAEEAVRDARGSLLRWLDRGLPHRRVGDRSSSTSLRRSTS